MDKKLEKELERLIEISNKPYHNDKLGMILAQMGKIFLFNPKVKAIIEEKSKLN